MSTAGKVLTVLILPVLLIWIILVSTVAQLNTEWTRLIDTRDKEIVKLEEDIKSNETEIQNLKDQVAVLQSVGEENHTVLRSKLAEVERQRSEAIEIQTRVTLQLESVQASVKTAETARDQRKAELANEQTEKKKYEDEVAKLSAENSAYMDQLTGLRNEFKSTVDANKANVESIKKTGAKKADQRAMLVR